MKSPSEAMNEAMKHVAPPGAALFDQPRNRAWSHTGACLVISRARLALGRWRTPLKERSCVSRWRQRASERVRPPGECRDVADTVRLAHLDS